MNNITMKINADELILQALREDITSEDITTNSVMPHYQAGEVDLICKQDGVIAGLEVFKRVFELLDSATEVTFYCKDGDTVKKGEKIGLVRGDIRVLLSGERTALNYLQRMSGIATYTREIADLLKGTKTKLLDTRKTTPNMRIFEKYSVKVGGGYNHRHRGDLEGATKHVIPEKEVSVQLPIVVVGSAAVVGLSGLQLSADLHNKRRPMLAQKRVFPLRPAHIGIHILKLL